MNILILDDDAFFLSVLKKEIEKIMKELSSEVSVRTYDEKNKFFEDYTEQVDIVFLDYHLGNNTSEDILQKIQEAFPKQKVVILSGQDDGKIVLNLIRMGIRNYVIKDEDHYENIKEILKEELELRS
jgi:DNA-binding NarL/FixJ family response regulator